MQVYQGVRGGLEVKDGKGVRRIGAAKGGAAAVRAPLYLLLLLLQAAMFLFCFPQTYLSSLHADAPTCRTESKKACARLICTCALCLLPGD